jgi:hypothetical protein
MKDLASRLRKHAEEVLDPGYPYYGTPEMVREAADEIERLRLTGEEREAIQAGIDALCTLNEDDAAMPLRALLKRLQ